MFKKTLAEEVSSRSQKALVCTVDALKEMRVSRTGPGQPAWNFLNMVGLTERVQEMYQKHIARSAGQIAVCFTLLGTNNLEFASKPPTCLDPWHRCGQ